MIWFTSITYIGSLWIFRINSISELMSLPFVGIVSIFTGAILLFFFLNMDITTVQIPASLAVGFF